MKIIKTKIKDLLIIEPEVFGDHRGWFSETYNKSKMLELGLDYDFVQDNHSFSMNKGTLRGLHFQNKPFDQAKLVRVTRGKVFDVALDLRINSSTYKQWVGVELSAKNRMQFLIPRGFAHGFVTLEENTEFVYKVDNYYDKESDRSIYYDDTEFSIAWPIDNPILSEKDQKAPQFLDCDIDL